MIIIDAPILKTGLCYGLGVGPVPFVAMSSLFPQVKLLPSLATIVFIQQLVSMRNKSITSKSLSVELQNSGYGCRTSDTSSGGYGPAEGALFTFQYDTFISAVYCRHFLI